MELQKHYRIYILIEEGSYQRRNSALITRLRVKEAQPQNQAGMLALVEGTGACQGRWDAC
jgi:hypothetical protein